MGPVVPEIARGPQQLGHGDVREERARLEEADPLVHEGEGDEPEALGERDVQEHLDRPHPDRLGGLDLALADGLEPRAEHLRLVPQRVDREGERGEGRCSISMMGYNAQR